jgi:hypothetical protein
VSDFSKKYCAANNNSVRRLPYLLTNFPNDVLIRDAFGSYYPLSTIVHAPFYIRQEEGHFVLFGTRVSDGEVACMRIIMHEGAPVLQWKQSLKEPWRFDEGWVPMQMLYVPVDVKVLRPESA